MSLYKNRYRVESARLPGWDYSSPGYYFVTICTHDRICLFGDIADGKMDLNEYGNIVMDEWHKSFDIRRELTADEFVVMPNHFHAIVHIGVETPCHGVSTETETETEINKNVHWKPGVLGAIIGQFKQQVTKRIRKNGLPHFAWQTRFHDHIINNDNELIRIRQYIKNNPKNWKCDKMNSSVDSSAIKETMNYGDELWMK